MALRGDGFPWEDSLDEARKLARKEGKRVLIDFSGAPLWGACLALDTVTYPDERVSAFVRQHLVPVKVLVKQQPDLAAQYDVIWTPTVILADEGGKAHYRFEGYLPPEDFVAQLALGLGRSQLERQQFAQAIHHFEEVVKRHPGTDHGAQALYWLGVANYKNSKDPAQLRPSWERLVREYPNSEWARRANVPKTS